MLRAPALVQPAVQNYVSPDGFNRELSPASVGNMYSERFYGSLPMLRQRR